MEFLSVLDGTISALASAGTTIDLTEAAPRVQRVRELLSKIAEEDGTKDRSAPLALLELEKRARAHGLSQGQYRDLRL